jgi:hypothetical protein
MCKNHGFLIENGTKMSENRRKMAEIDGFWWKKKIRLDE